MDILTRLKDKKLQETIISVIMILTLLYAGLSFLLNYNSTHDFLSFLSTPSFSVSVIFFVIIFVVWKISKGSRIIIPKQEKVEMNLPNQFPNKENPSVNFPNVFKQTTKPVLSKPSVLGTWRCPYCNFLAYGEYCTNCNRKR